MSVYVTKFEGERALRIGEVEKKRMGYARKQYLQDKGHGHRHWDYLGQLGPTFVLGQQQ
jgi:hypothetical protein